MANFEVRIRRIASVENHPDADRLSLNKIDGFTIVSNKHEDGSHRYKAGDLVIYVPENAIVPEYLLRQGYWNEEKGIGYLAGKEGNRVKPIKLRGVLSEGIVFPVEKVRGVGYTTNRNLTNNTVHNNKDTLFIDEGDDVAEFLGITKWAPEIPTSMSGSVFHCSQTINFDIENIKNYPDVIPEGEAVNYTEKLHGTNVQMIYLPNGSEENFVDGKFTVASKGLAQKHLAFQDNEENRNGNLYMKALLAFIPKIQNFETFFSNAKKVVFLGEIYGKGIQDLHYGLTSSKVAIFDINIDGEWISEHEITQILFNMEVDQVPYLYSGPHSIAKMDELKRGKTTINSANVREGLVIRPSTERRDDRIGRVILKAINEDYLLRKNATEYQ